MRNDLPKLNQKTLTKLINEKFRKSLHAKLKLSKIPGLIEYAKYVVDSQIMQKIQEYSDNAKSGWGFPQLNVICAVKSDGTVEKKLFEFNSINHFLKDCDGDTAVEVVECILGLWANTDKSIVSFDYQKIDEELVKLEKEAEEIKAKELKREETANQIKEKAQPILESLDNLSYEEFKEKATAELTKILDELKNSNAIASYIVSFDRNTRESVIIGNAWFVDIAFKLEDGIEFTVLTCSVTGNNGVNASSDYPMSA